MCMKLQIFHYTHEVINMFEVIVYGNAVHVGRGRQEFSCKTRKNDKTLEKVRGGFHTETLYAFCIYPSDKHVQ